MDQKQNRNWGSSRRWIAARMGQETPEGSVTITIPNYLTLARVVMIPLFWISFFATDLSWQVVASALFIIGAITDLVDGKLARRLHQVTPFGGFADPLADKAFVLSGYWAILIREDLGVFYTTALIWIAIITVRELLVTIRRTKVVSDGGAVVTTMLAKVKTGISLSTLIALLVVMNLRDYLILHNQLPAVAVWLDGKWFDLITNFFFFAGAVPTVISGILYLKPPSPKTGKQAK